MRFAVVLIVILSVAICAADNIDDLIAAGDLNRAEEYIARVYARNVDSPEYLFLQGKTALSGESSASHLKDFINKTNDENYIPDWARLLLGKYYMAQGLYVTAARQFRSISDGSPFSAESNYLAARCYLLSGEYEDALLHFTEIIDRPQQTDYYYWANLGMADSYYESGNYQEAARNYYGLLRPELGDDIYALALSGMIETSRALNKDSDADYYYRQYQERYRTGISLAAYQEKPSRQEQREVQQQEKPAERPQTERGRYYIQVGAFSKKDNAVRFADLYRQSGYDVYMETFIERGNEYYRILIGGYNSKQQAEFIQRRLEKAMGEKYILLKR
jgi:tetratricopeptide (TPR) repeat protein